MQVSGYDRRTMDQSEIRRHLGSENDRLAVVRQDVLGEATTGSPHLDGSYSQQGPAQREGLAGQDGLAEQDGLAGQSVTGQPSSVSGTEAFDRERDLAIVERVEAQLRGIQAALERLDAGTYGVCEACGKPIEDARLEAVPAARFCEADQRRSESGAQKLTEAE